MKGLSENIRVRSLVGRFLEHARVFYFENSTGAQPLVLAGSADWMPRNFVRRVEALFPIESAELRNWILRELLPMELKDNENARILHANGAYLPPPRRANEPGFSVQAYFVAAAYQRAHLARTLKAPRKPSSRPKDRR
jgi:polyphosphate kinase